MLLLSLLLLLAPLRDTCAGRDVLTGRHFGESSDAVPFTCSTRQLPRFPMLQQVITDMQKDGMLSAEMQAEKRDHMEEERRQEIPRSKANSSEDAAPTPLHQEMCKIHQWRRAQNLHLVDHPEPARYEKYISASSSSDAGGGNSSSLRACDRLQKTRTSEEEPCVQVIMKRQREIREVIAYWSVSPAAFLSVPSPRRGVSFVHL